MNTTASMRGRATYGGIMHLSYILFLDGLINNWEFPSKDLSSGSYPLYAGFIGLFNISLESMIQGLSKSLNLKNG